MLKYSIKRIALFLLISANCFTQELNNQFKNLYDLYYKKDYFRFIVQSNQSADELETPDKLVLSSFIKALLNKPLESNDEIDSLLEYYSNNIHDSLKLKLLETKLQNLGSIYNYQSAFNCIDTILSQYKHLLDSASLDDFNNFLVILKATKNLGLQNTHIVGDSRVKINKDMAGLINIELKINGNRSEFIFDTGANISTIMESNADKFKLKYLEGNIKVGTVTGNKVDARLAYAEDLQIGNMKFENVLFIVLPDDALTFGGGFYKIDGIIGLPVIKEMKELHLTEKELFVPIKTTLKPFQNLVFDGFTPVVNVAVEKDTLPFNFDTGARKTVLYNSYFLKHENDLRKRYKIEEFEIEGAGGEKKIKGVKLDELRISIGGSDVILKDLRILAEEVEFHKNIFGNLGQDYFEDFDEMILNFENMYIDFIKK